VLDSAKFGTFAFGKATCKPVNKMVRHLVLLDGLLPDNPHLLDNDFSFNKVVCRHIEYHLK